MYMIKIRNRWLMLCNSVLSFVLTLFGLSSCDIESPDEYGSPVVMEYGSPYAVYEASGAVLDEEGKGVQGEEVILREIFTDDYEGRDIVLSDTTRTDENGKYKISIDYPPYRDIKSRIVAHDPNGTYEDDSLDVTPEKIEDGKGTWYQGLYANKQNFTLKKKK